MTLTKTTPNTAEEVGKKTSVISDQDVLMGRGARATENEGNVRFRHVVRSRLRDYLTAPRRQEKDQIAREILAVVKSRNGRFLKKVESMDESQGGSDFVEVHDDVALLKVKQALRDQKMEDSNASVVSNGSSKGAAAPSEATGLVGKENPVSPLLPGASLVTAESFLVRQMMLNEQVRAQMAVAESPILGGDLLLRAKLEQARRQALLSSLAPSAVGLPPLGLPSLNTPSLLTTLDAGARIHAAQQQANLQDLLLKAVPTTTLGVRAGGFQELGDLASAQRLLKRPKIV